MVVYTLDIPYRHQRNLLFLLFACDIKYYIPYFFIQSNILAIALNCYKTLNNTEIVASNLFIGYL